MILAWNKSPNGAVYFGDGKKSCQKVKNLTFFLIGFSLSFISIDVPNG
jgi:hypothetical protein